VNPSTLGTTSAHAATCSDVDVAFARGTGETPGLGITGRPFVSALTSRLSGYSVTSHAVDYAANSSQSSAAPGATDMSSDLSSVAAACPSTRFVIGGHSRGPTVTDIAIGIRAGVTIGTPISANLAGRVAAVVVFGSEEASTTYGPRSRDYCNVSDSICGRRGSNPAGEGSGGHLEYASNGSTPEGAQLATTLVRAGGGTGNPTPTPIPTTCITASTLAYVVAPGCQPRRPCLRPGRLGAHELARHGLPAPDRRERLDTGQLVLRRPSTGAGRTS
jgi:cutinase